MFKNLALKKIKCLLQENIDIVENQTRELSIWPEYKNTLKYEFGNLGIATNNFKIEFIKALFFLKESDLK